MRDTQNTLIIWNAYSPWVQRVVPILLPILIQSAYRNETITYGALCSRVGLANTLISKPLGCIARLLMSLENSEPVPPLTSIAVYSRNGRPSNSIYEYGIVSENEPIENAQRRVYNYKNWDVVSSVLLGFIHTHNNNQE